MTPATTKNVPGSLPWYDEDEYAVCLRDSRTLPVILSGRRSCVPLHPRRVRPRVAAGRRRPKGRNLDLVPLPLD